MLVQYNNGLETICKKNHKSMSILWDFLESQLVWKLLLRIFANYFPPLIFTWGMVVWTSLVCVVFQYDAESLGHAFTHLVLNDLLVFVAKWAMYARMFFFSKKISFINIKKCRKATNYTIIECYIQKG